MTKNYAHTPVLLEEAIEGMNICKDGIFIDATFGSGGHSKKILSLLSSKGKLIAFDQDKLAFKYAPNVNNFILFHSNFIYLKNFIKLLEISQVDGIIADLGISSMHIDMAERGFSYRFNAPLDMRMNREQDFTAQDVVNNYSQETLAKIFFEYGQLRNANTIAKSIVKAREHKKIITTYDLVAIVEKLIPSKIKNKVLSKIFQAIRIEVNEELENLKIFLQIGTEVLKKGGRFVIITFHSLEDRIVKNYFKTGTFDGIVKKDIYGNAISPLRPVNKKVIVPSEQEQNQNPRSRSAKLRISEKL